MPELPPTPAVHRSQLIEQLRSTPVWDMVIVGGGATGLGLAVDAAHQGWRVALLESRDFAQGTSSRSTKLLHGGVRYLAQGNISLVREALHERATLLRNASHLAQPLGFVMPAYHWWQRPFYGAGLTIYDALAGRQGLGRTRWLGRQGALALAPTLQAKGLQGGIRYWDGQFDDARLAVALARTAIGLGACVINHCRVNDLTHENGRVTEVKATDALSGSPFTLRTRCVVNATGVWVDLVRNMDCEPGTQAPRPMVAPSQGVHLVVDRRFLPGRDAILVPKTEDGRVLFAVPWMGKVILGTTDTPRRDLAEEPEPFGQEVEFILREAGRYLSIAPRREDVLSAWVGLRPLVRPPSDAKDGTQALSREHTVLVSPSGLVTVTGGKWTTYRAMAEDVVAQCLKAGLLAPAVQTRSTDQLLLAGASRSDGPETTALAWPGSADDDHMELGVESALPAGLDAASQRPLTEPPGPHLYGTDAPTLARLPGSDAWLWRDGEGGLSEAMVRFAARHEMAHRVEDVLARRSRLLFLDARAAANVAPRVADILREELGPDAAPDLATFQALCARYTHLP